mmetsp:Transcript_35689/g.44270  ORF Transcript_35689/g.44270 Transcript_35689/m.44270 type:complete len:167 (-) Transcript_35689:1018-1518(-)
MILTDGIINDLDETIAMIVHASHLPMSIIIVGVGSADFSTMEALDSDERLLRDRNGNVACRDIVQFVPFSKFGGDGTLLAKEVLAEIPKQIVGFMRMKRIRPNPQTTYIDTAAYGKHILQQALGNDGGQPIPTPAQAQAPYPGNGNALPQGQYQHPPSAGDGATYF